MAQEHWCSSGFANTDLDLQLKVHGIHRLIVIGLLAHTCVEATVRFAAELGYDVTVVKDATASYSEMEMHAALEVNIPNDVTAVVTTRKLVESISSRCAPRGHVPGGTSEETVQEVRTREATRSRQLAAEGHLLRPWRPPPRPGEWRTLGLFAAADDGQLEEVLASMPLRVWRTDEVLPLLPHPHDPPHRECGAAEHVAPGAEFLITLTVRVPEGTPEEVVEEAYAREAAHSRVLGAEGHLLRLWRVPPRSGERRALGLWRARDAIEMQALLEGLPMIGWMDTETTPLAQHPNDPSLAECT